MGTNLAAVLGRQIDADEVVALLCPHCIKGALMMHPVSAKCPHEELVRFVKNETKFIKVVGMGEGGYTKSKRDKKESE